MPPTPTTRAQVDGHRFLLRRARHAVVSRDVRMLHDPLGRQGAGLATGSSSPWSRAPAPRSWRSSARPRTSTARRSSWDATPGRCTCASGTPSTRCSTSRAPGSCSARRPSRSSCATRISSGPHGAGSSAYRGRRPPCPHRSTTPPPRRCGGPSATSGRGTGARGSTGPSSWWTGCPRGAGGPRDDATRPLGADGAVLASFDGGGWLLRDGTRAAVDLHDRPLLEALGLADAPVREVSAALLDALPEVGAVERPGIPGAGEPVPYGLPGLRVGQVFTVTTAGGVAHHVALRDGVQEVGEVLADLVRATVTVGDVVTVAPDALDVPRSTALPAGSFPRSRPVVPAPAAAPVVCARSVPDASLATRRHELSSGAALPTDRAPVEVASADGGGPSVDAVVVPGGGILLAAVPRSGEPRSSARTVLTDTGVRHDVPDEETATTLGLGGTPVPVEALVLWRLPAGPVLDRGAALLRHDGIAPDASAVAEAPR